MQQLLVLNIAPRLEEDLVDLLLSLDAVGGFTSYPVRGHGRTTTHTMSLTEQVTGRRKRVQFELLLDEKAVPGLLEALAESVGRDVYWWTQPILASGHLN